MTEWLDVFAPSKLENIEEWNKQYEGRFEPKVDRLAETRARIARNEVMAEKLYDQVQRGCIDNEWAESFICDMHARIEAGLPLSEKQELKLEEIFERY